MWLRESSRLKKARTPEARPRYLLDSDWSWPVRFKCVHEYLGNKRITLLSQARLLHLGELNTAFARNGENIVCHESPAYAVHPWNILSSTACVSHGNKTWFVSFYENLAKWPTSRRLCLDLVLTSNRPCLHIVRSDQKSYSLLPHCSESSRIENSLPPFALA